jgi:hypothetical protein
MKARSFCEICGGRLDPIWEPYGVHRACWLEAHADELEDVGCATCMGAGRLTGDGWVMECPICHPRTGDQWLSDWRRRSGGEAA